MKTLLLCMSACSTIALTPGTTWAQTGGPGGNSGNVGDTDPIVVPLSVGGDVQLIRNGHFAAAATGVNVTGYFSGSRTGSRDPRPPSPPSPPSVSVVDFQTFEA